jgi:predicted RNA binding protein YcfA (HicA-like mRNA interferase family)
VSQVEKLLLAMRCNPRGDWTIDDVRNVCDRNGINFDFPKRGSHCKLSHPKIPGRLTIPSRRPIKPIYIMLLLDMISALEQQQ